MNENIDLFDIYAGRVLNELLCKFPMPSDLKVPKLTIDRLNDKDEEKHREIIYHTINWLADENFIRYRDKTLGLELFTDVVLTSKGLKTLKQTPKNLSDNPTLATSLKKAIATGKDELIKQAVNAIFSVGA